MTRRLPNTNDVVALVKASATRSMTEKQASAVVAGPEYKTDVAAVLHKLAMVLKDPRANTVTYAEVEAFAQRARMS